MVIIGKRLRRLVIIVSKKQLAAIHLNHVQKMLANNVNNEIKQ